MDEEHQCEGDGGRGGRLILALLFDDHCVKPMQDRLSELVDMLGRPVAIKVIHISAYAGIYFQVD